MERLFKLKDKHPAKIREFYQMEPVTSAKPSKFRFLRKILDRVRGKVPAKFMPQTPFHSLYTYVKFAKKVCFVIVIIAGVFLIIKAVKAYRLRQYRIQQKEIEQRLEVEEGLKDSVFVDLLLSKIFDSQNKGESNKAPILVSKQLCQNFDIDESTTSPCSCEYGEEECVGCNNGNISEISYCNDVIPDEVNLVVHNANSCSEYTKKAEADKLKRHLHHFNKNFKNLRSKVLQDTCKDAFNYVNKHELTTDTEEFDPSRLLNSSNKYFNPSKACGHAKNPSSQSTMRRTRFSSGMKRLEAANKKRGSISKSIQNIKQVNFFEILSQLSNEYAGRQKQA